MSGPFFTPLSLLPLRLTALVTLIAGFIYFFKQSPMGYHQRFLGTPFEELPAKTQGLVLALLHAAGCGLISIGLSLGFLAWGPVPAGDRWAAELAFMLLAATTLTMPAVTLRLAYYTPWWLILLAGFSSMAGLWSFAWGGAALPLR